MSKITGNGAIERAQREGLVLRKYADPTEGARCVSISEACEIASEDPSLIYAVQRRPDLLSRSSIEELKNGLHDRDTMRLLLIFGNLLDYIDPHVLANAYNIPDYEIRKRRLGRVIESALYYMTQDMIDDERRE